MTVAAKALKIHTHIRKGDLAVAALRLVRPRRLAPVPQPDGEGYSARRINTLLAGMTGAQRYLEIGLMNGDTFEDVRATERWGVDPRPRFDLGHLPPRSHVAVATSDAFFALNPGALFDVIFLDGLHTFRQTYRDLVNALKVCSNGAILIDDVVPSSETSAIPDHDRSLEERSRLGLKGLEWHGDVFRVVLCVGKHHPELSFRTIVGSGSPQTLVWRNDPEAVVDSVGEEDLVALEAVSFTDVFAGVLPAEFRPATESEAMADWAARIAPAG